MAKKDHKVEIWTGTSSKPEVRWVTESEALAFEELPFTDPNVTSTRVTPPQR